MFNEEVKFYVISCNDDYAYYISHNSARFQILVYHHSALHESSKSLSEKCIFKVFTTVMPCSDTGKIYYRA